MKMFSAFILLCLGLSRPPAVFSQITEEEVLTLIANNDLVLARERIQEARREAPNSAFAAYYSAVLEEDADAAASAFLDFSKRFADSAYSDDALYRLGQYYFARGNFNRSRQYYVELTKKQARSPLASAAQYQAAKALLLAGDLYGAKAELENVTRQFPNTWMSQFAQEDLQQETLKTLPVTSAAPPRSEGKSTLPTPATAEERGAAPPDAANKTEPKSQPTSVALSKAERPIDTPATTPARKEQPKVEVSSAKKTEPSKPKPKPLAVYAVQVGAYLQRMNADDQKKRYAQAGYKTEVVEKQEGRRKYFAVWVGELTTREQAYALVEELKKKFKVRAHTVRRDE